MIHPHIITHVILDINSSVSHIQLQVTLEIGYFQVNRILKGKLKQDSVKSFHKLVIHYAMELCDYELF